MQPSDESAKPKKRLLTLISAVVALTLIGAAVYLRSRPAEPQTEAAATTSQQEAFTLEELEANDGREGRKCYVAVDGKVYEIEQGRLWRDGEHATSQGQAHCGKDLSEAITKSPHGKSKLEALTVVGTLE